ncbi:cation-translocating P-type ATPase [Endothiovibrio diazotrophicus]
MNDPGTPLFHPLTADEALHALDGSPHGLSADEAAARLARVGPNALPQPTPPGLAAVFFRQFLSPLIYILLLAAGVSLALHEWSDAAFIFAVLLINAVIGTAQEFSAEKSAQALRNLVTATTRVQRDGDAYEIRAEELVPGDVVLLEPGNKVPADLRLLDGHGLQLDESLLTGESLPVHKLPAEVFAADTPLGDRRNMAFAGSMVTRGHGRGVVTATALGTELGRIASAVLDRPPAKAPLVLRMEVFTTRVAMMVGGAVVVMAAVSLYQGAPWSEIFLLSVALAVSAIPEGLPVALTVALAIGMRRMARRNVIVRRLVAVEALGSCTYIASDKTGTLTVNEMTAKRIELPGGEPRPISGEGSLPEGIIHAPPEEMSALLRICEAAVLTNDGFLGHRDGGWVHHGDAVDVALLAMAHKAGITRPDAQAAHPERANIPFESEHGYSATLNRVGECDHAFVKGALERLLPMCEWMVTPEGEAPLDREALERQALAMAGEGYRVLAFAAGPVAVGEEEEFEHDRLRGLTLLGLVGMIDPLRPEAKSAVAACHDAGIEVCMVTGDHPATARAIAGELAMGGDGEVITGQRLRELEGDALGTDRAVAASRVFARVEPQQKLDIVHSLGRQGHFVAVTGDGANDAPALRAAHVGVAMGKRGTDVARETADLILTDDHFASIVAGVEEGRIAYANVRKVIFLLISTGAAELVLFTLSLAAGLPLPLTAVQLLWLNLVTNGIQDVALAFEPGEGHELKQPPRDPKEPIFNRLMIERTVITALTMGGLAFAIFHYYLGLGMSVDEARNSALLLMVLFENVHVFNSRSETLSAFLHNPLRNPLLLFGTVAAQLIHIGAMYTPGLSGVLGAMPVTLEHWAEMLFVALLILVVLELHKLLWRRR